jgi:hypothetical protein
MGLSVSHWVICSSRVRTEFTFQVAIFIGVGYRDRLGRGQGRTQKSGEPIAGHGQDGAISGQGLILVKDSLIRLEIAQRAIAHHPTWTIRTIRKTYHEMRHIGFG